MYRCKWNILGGYRKTYSWRRKTKVNLRQRHEPLAFLSGAFAQEAVKRLDYLSLQPVEFMICTDRQNFIYMLHPEASDGNTTRYQADKLTRWTMSMTNYQCKITHILVDDIVRGDLLSRWGRFQQQGVKITNQEVSPLRNPDFICPYLDEIRELQLEGLQHLVTAFWSKKECGFLMKHWIWKIGYWC